MGVGVAVAGGDKQMNTFIRVADTIWVRADDLVSVEVDGSDIHLRLRHTNTVLGARCGTPEAATKEAQHLVALFNCGPLTGTRPNNEWTAVDRLGLLAQENPND